MNKGTSYKYSNKFKYKLNLLILKAGKGSIFRKTKMIILFCEAKTSEATAKNEMEP
jgi:hypothetical protein